MRRTLAALALAVVLPLPALAAQIVVQPGETLSEIAERHQISVSRLMQINGITNADQVEAGQRLTVPGSASASMGRGNSSGGGTRVTVREGETLSEIADRHGLSMARLMQINGITDPDLVEAGRSLVISTAAPRSAAVSGSSYRRGAREHVVRPGESLSVIAEGYGLPMSKLVAINSISDPNKVEAGTRLRLRSLPPLPESAAPRPQPTTARPAAPAVKPAAAAKSTAKPATAARPAPAVKPVVAAKPVATTATPTIASATASAAAGRGPSDAENLAGAAPETDAETGSSNTSESRPQTQPAPRAAVRPAPRPVVTTAVSKPMATVATASKPASTQGSGGKPGKPASPDWRSYGPLQVDWANWQPMGGSMVTPSLNAEGQSQYLAINCGARKLNATSPTGQWKSWDDPRADFEQQIVNDLCKARS